MIPRMVRAAGRISIRRETIIELLSMKSTRKPRNRRIMVNIMAFMNLELKSNIYATPSAKSAVDSMTLSVTQKSSWPIPEMVMKSDDPPARANRSLLLS